MRWERALQRKWKPCMLGTGVMTDCYNPLELELQYTKQALELIKYYGFGVTVHTKSNRLLRDFELLQHIHEKSKCVVQMTLTTLDEQLCKKWNVFCFKKREHHFNKFEISDIPFLFF